MALRCLEVKMIVEIEADDSIPDWVLFGEIASRASEVAVVTGNANNGESFTIDAFAAGFKRIDSCSAMHRELVGYDGQDVGFG